MATKFLDKTGLAYFWNKIKNYITNLLSSKADDSNVVHKTGAENISGVKVLANNLYITKNSPILITQASNITRNVAPSEIYGTIEINGRDSAGNSTWGLYHTYDTNKVNRILLICYNGTKTTNDWNGIGVGYDSSGNAFTVAPTPSTADNSTQIATTAFVKAQGYLTSHQSLSNYVTLDGNQTITGIKTYTKDIIMHDDDPSITYKFKTPVRGTVPSTGYYTFVTDIKDKDGNCFGGLYHEYVTSGANTISLMAYNGLSTSSGEWSRLQVGYDNTGVPFTTAVNPPAAATDNRIATCKWVTDKGYLTSHQSLDSCVKTSGNQDVSGYKIFTTSLTVKRVNPYLYFVETDATKGGTTSTDFQGIYFCDKNFNSTAANDNYTLAQIARAGSTADYNILQFTVKENTANTNTGKTVQFGHMGGKTDDYWYMHPSGTGVVKLGSNQHRWGQIYTSTSVNTNSDERIKNDIDAIPELVLDVWDKVQWKQFKFNEAIERKGFNDARLHTGVVAQDIQKIFNDSGVDVDRYGFFCYDSWEAKEPIFNKEGSLIFEGSEKGDAYSIRYEEALCIEAAYQRRKNRILENRISELEKRLAKLEGVI